MTFQDQVVLITGASNGIGRRLAIDLAARGAIVASQRGSTTSKRLPLDGLDYWTTADVDLLA